MIISKKKFAEAIKQAKEEVYKEVEQREYQRNEERRTNFLLPEAAAIKTIGAERIFRNIFLTLIIQALAARTAAL